jgi:hypothetical protein
LGDIVVGLRVSNNLGDVAETSITLSYLPAPASFFSIVSEPFEYIGQGQLWLLKDPGAISTGLGQYQDNSLRVSYNDENTNFELQIKAPDGANLEVGEYLNATRLPFQEPQNPGLDFSGEGRGCNMLTGSFTILELNYNADGEIDQLAIDVVQFCEQPDGPKLTAQIRLNSSLPINP